jgi:hypothetical protein
VYEIPGVKRVCLPNDIRFIICCNVEIKVGSLLNVKQKSDLKSKHHLPQGKGINGFGISQKYLWPSLGLKCSSFLQSNRAFHPWSYREFPYLPTYELHNLPKPIEVFIEACCLPYSNVVGMNIYSQSDRSWPKRFP